jgi:hypothetical protein
MSRGFHAFFRQYSNLRALLRRVDPDLRSVVPGVAPPSGGITDRSSAEDRLIKNDCPRFGGIDALEQRLNMQTPHPRIMLARDGIRCDFTVALMQRGNGRFPCANELLTLSGLAGHDFWTVPMRPAPRLRWL